MILHERYEVIRPLGSGGAGQTYLARDLEGDREVVVKELFGPAGEGAPRELVALQRFWHPQVQRYVETFIEEVRLVPRMHLVTEYVPGRPLAEAKLGQDQVLDVIAQLLEIVDFLHGQSPPLLHRDIKPANVILRDDGQIVLIDFGLATEGVERTFQHTMAAGTLGYQAPEQIAGDPSPSSDLYSVGVTALELLTGRAPFDLLSGMGLRWERAAAHLPAWLQGWLATMLAPEKADRFPNAKAALDALRAQDAAPPLPAVTEPKQALWPVYVAVLALLMVPIGVFISDQSEAPSEVAELPAGPTGCEGGDAEACLEEAEALRDVLAEERDPERAGELTARACLLGSKDGCWSIATAYGNHGWLQEDPEEALRWWLEACALNTTNACDQLERAAEQVSPEVRAARVWPKVQALGESCAKPLVREREDLEAHRCARAVEWLEAGWAGERAPEGELLRLNTQACELGALWACVAVAESKSDEQRSPIMTMGLYLWLCERGVPEACDKADRVDFGVPEGVAVEPLSPLDATSPTR